MLSQKQRRKQSVARVVLPSSTKQGRHVNSRLLEEDRTTVQTSCIDSFPTPHSRRRLLPDVVSHSNSGNFKQQTKSTVMCVGGSIPSTTSQFFYSGPVDRYDLGSTSIDVTRNNSVDLTSPKRHHRSSRQYSIHPHTTQDLLSRRVSESRSASRCNTARVSRVGSSISCLPREFKADFTDSKGSRSLGRVRERRSHTVQLQRIPVFSCVEELEVTRRDGRRDTDTTRPTPRRRMSQMSHQTARFSERAPSIVSAASSSHSRALDQSSSNTMSSSRSSSVAYNSRRQASVELEVDTGYRRQLSHRQSGNSSALDLTRIAKTPECPNSEDETCSEDYLRDTDRRDEDTHSDQTSTSQWITFADTPPQYNANQAKIVLRFSSTFWLSGECASSPVEKVLHQAFVEKWKDPNQRECVIQQSSRCMEQGMLNCGEGLLEVERSLHHLLTRPPGVGVFPPHITCGGGEAMPILRPKLETGGPSFFTCIRRKSGGPIRIPYMSDCYDKIICEQDLRQAWFYLVRSGTAALISQLSTHHISEPVIVSLCTRHFVKYAYVCLTKEDSIRHGVTVYPLSRKLRWDSPTDREDLSTLSLCVMAWLMRCC
eukprot:Blabericola_migrator_1__8940@NODE_473_length_8210_cov_514_124279_g369_i0_p2_GENE_NODE_473_length_8210_cov_514_124279_g369_i0NODE_473_length_8210_cov_514_124279_g369_i0_p2_ORF_typecomplete_len598_score54_52_NODE_473_length_8210_cov_514_124279_g369_i09212714